MKSTLLLVEDKEEDVLLFENALARSGLSHSLNVCRDGVEALDYLTGSPPFNDRERFPVPQVIFLDLTLPKVSGGEVLRFLRTRPEWNASLVVVLTASLRVDDLRQAYSLGADSFLTKPCRPEDLQALAKAFPNRWSKAAPTAGITMETPAREIIHKTNTRTLPIAEVISIPYPQA